MFLARDVYPQWKRLITKAQDSITIYSPFFDGLILSVLKANSKLASERITIVTNFNYETGLEFPAQLLTIKKAMSKGISVLNLRGLHAKVLLVDEKYVILGSQNFTSRGRKNEEVSVMPQESLEGSKFTETLLRWRKQAEELDEALVERLISELKSYVRKHRKLLDETFSAFENVLQQHEYEQQLRIKRHLEELERKSRIKMASGEVYASLEMKSGRRGEDYYSLVADSKYDMTNWIIKKSDGSLNPYKLSRLSMYPMILADTLQMGFARIGRTRITYIRDVIDWTNKILEMGDYRLKVSISFPDTGTRKRNIIIKISHAYSGTCEFTMLFTGDVINIIRKSYFKGSPHWREEHKELVSELEKKFFGSASALKDFWRKFFTHFTYRTLGLRDKNVRNYLKGPRFRLSVIQYQENPFLVISKVR